MVPETAGNYGIQQTINVGGASSSQSLVQFDLSTLPAGTTASGVSKATLCCTREPSQPPAPSIFQPPMAPGLKQLSQAIIPLPLAQPWPAVSARRPAMFTSTLTLRLRFRAGLRRLRAITVFIITPVGGVSVTFDSKESTSTSHAPELVITTGSSGAGGATGATGTTGATGSADATGPTVPPAPFPPHHSSSTPSSTMVTMGVPRFSLTRLPPPPTMAQPASLSPV